MAPIARRVGMDTLKDAVDAATASVERARVECHRHGVRFDARSIVYWCPQLSAG